MHHYCGSPRNLGAVFPNASVAALKITASERSQVDTRPWECSHCLAIPIAGVDRQQPIWWNWASVEMENWTEAVVSRDGSLNAAFSDSVLFYQLPLLPQIAENMFSPHLTGRDPTSNVGAVWPTTDGNFGVARVLIPCAFASLHFLLCHRIKNYQGCTGVSIRTCNREILCAELSTKWKYFCTLLEFGTSGFDYIKLPARARLKWVI